MPKEGTKKSNQRQPGAAINQQKSTSASTVGASSSSVTIPQFAYVERPPSKSQQRKEKKRQQVQTRREHAIAADEQNARFSQGRIEGDAFVQVLQQRCLGLVDIKPDGDCLYGAIVDQLIRRSCPALSAQKNEQSERPSIASSGAPSSKPVSTSSSSSICSATGNNNNAFTVNSLRALAAAHIKSHRDEFLPFLLADDASDRALDEFDFDAYCEQIKKPGQWGGEPELRALSSALGRRIDVLYADGRTTTFYGEPSTGENGNDKEGTYPDEQTLTITFHRFAYRLGEHYNSTRQQSS